MNNQNLEVHFHIDVISVNIVTGEATIGMVKPIDDYKYTEGVVSIIVPMTYPTPDDMYLIQIHATPDFFLNFPIGEVVLEGIDMAMQWLDEVDSGTLN